MVKFLDDNKTWCGVPDQVITVVESQSRKIGEVPDQWSAATTDAPQPKAPSLSDAIKTPTVDSATNTKTGHGTFDTLTGNPLAR